MLESQGRPYDTDDSLRELSFAEIDEVAGGSLSGALAGATTMFGGGVVGYGATLAVGVGLGAVGAAALGGIAVAAIGYGAYELVSNA